MVKQEIVQLDERNAEDFWMFRKELFLELGEVPAEMDLSKLESATKQYYISHINKDLLSWGLYRDGKMVSIGSLCLFFRIPYQENLTGAEGYILNIFTSPHFRKCGFASQILDTIMAYSKQHEIRRLWLSNSEQGKGLYNEKGFVQKENEMELFL